MAIDWARARPPSETAHAGAEVSPVSVPRSSPSTSMSRTAVVPASTGGQSDWASLA
ncbi:hypothetical protein ACFQY4_12100 [Catellatospora bangladeshensis]|uniref:hypothetical protein n=1 Tax=Catellatospora bangladeshensis TaxID=310355 RepID=UPI00361FA015